MEKLYTPAEAAEYFGIKIGTCWKWLRDGYLKGIRVGRSYAIPESEILRLDEAGARHSGKPSIRHSFFVRINGKPVKITEETIPDDPAERAVMWHTFFLEHPEFKKKAPGQAPEPEPVFTGLRGYGLKEEFNRYAAEAVKYDEEQTPNNTGEETRENDN